MQLGHNSKIDLIKSVPLFASASKSELAEIASIADEIDLPAGKTLIKEGDSGHEFFVIVEGTADVERGGKKIAKLGPGDFFGEIGLLGGERRVASVTATSPMRLVVLTGAQLRAIESRMAPLGERIRAAMAERLEADSARG
jgi:CRP/FNR family transcriptional regulator, cyclic AMP receptor protein